MLLGHLYFKDICFFIVNHLVIWLIGLVKVQVRSQDSEEASP